VHEIPTEDRLLVGRVLGRYDELLGVVGAVPQGCCTGEFFPKNVMIRAGSPGIAKRAKHVAQWTHELRTAVEQHS
jgi:hypothetical protein